MGVIQFKGGTGTIKFKGGTIQFKNLGKVANPTITAMWGQIDRVSYQIRVTNNDTETATIYAGRSTPPTTSYGDLAGGATTTITVGAAFQPPEGATFTGYVQMKATGRTDSDIVSDVSDGYYKVIEG